jgi:hypothetical protein
MKKLTLRPRLGTKSIESIEQILGEQFPKSFSEFLIENAGLSHLECKFIDKNNQLWIVHEYNNYKDLYGLTNEFLNEYERKMVPFAFDSGGWHFCLCFDEKSKHEIFIHRWTDYKAEERFLKIADSFEEFTEGLHAE